MTARDRTGDAARPPAPPTGAGRPPCARDGWAPGRPARRSVLAGALAAVPLLAACTGGDDGAPPDGEGRTGGRQASPGPDGAVVERAVATTRSLVAGATALRASRPALAATLEGVLATHAAHLAALGAPARPAPAQPPGPSGTPTAATAAGSTQDAAPAPSGAGTSAPGSAVATSSPSATAAAPSPQTVVTAERRAAAQALDDSTVATPDVAVLLARIAAARAVHGDLLAAAAALPGPGPLPGAVTGPGASGSAPGSPSGSAPGSPSGSAPGSPSAGAPSASPAPTPPAAELAVLGSMIAGEHAAVHAYGLVTARVSRSRTAAARQAWDRHRARRDALEEVVLAAGGRPPAAAPAYDVGRPPSTPAAAVELAARVEDGVAAVAASAVAATTGPRRRDAGDALCAAARAAAAWRGSTTPLPGR